MLFAGTQDLTFALFFFFLMGEEGLGGDDDSDDSVVILALKRFKKASEVFCTTALAFHIKVAFVACFVFPWDGPPRWPFCQIPA